ncbi:outer membrane protein [Methylobacterium sp. JK268]
MRIVTSGFLAGLVVAGLTPARAADLDFAALRGSAIEAAAPTGNWEGVYFGGHGGWTSTSFGFGNVFQEPVATYLRDTRTEKNLNASQLLRPYGDRRDATTFGAYAGMNFQFDEIVVGAELDYTHLGKTGSTSDQIWRELVASDGFLDGVKLNGTAKTRIDDYATLRARFGYDLGNFLPFVTGGFAIGRAQITDTTYVRDYGYDQKQQKSNQATGQNVEVTSFGYSDVPGGALAAPVALSKRKEKIVGGVAAGGGLEFALTANILLRAEYQWVQFNDFDGHKANLNTVRGGAAVKF